MWDLCSGFTFIYGEGFGAPGSVFTAQGLEKRKKTQNFESRAKVGSAVIANDSV